MFIGQRSRRHIAPFELHRPRAVQDVLSIMAAHPNAVLMAGGLDVIDRLKFGEAVPHIIELRAIPGLSDVICTRSTIRIGAMATHAAIASAPQLHAALPDLPRIWRSIANPRIRYTGTIGGNIMAAQPHYDALPALLALGASAVLAGQPRPIQLRDLPDHPSPFLLCLRIPRHPALRLVAERSLHPAISLYAAALVADGHVARLRLALSGAHDTPRLYIPRGIPLSQPTLARDADDIATEFATRHPATKQDGLGSLAWRTRMIEVLTRRLLLRLANIP